MTKINTVNEIKVTFPVFTQGAPETAALKSDVTSLCPESSVLQSALQHPFHLD